MADETLSDAKLQEALPVLKRWQDARTLPQRKGWCLAAIRASVTGVGLHLPAVHPADNSARWNGEQMVANPAQYGWQKVAPAAARYTLTYFFRVALKNGRYLGHVAILDNIEKVLYSAVNYDLTRSWASQLDHQSGSPGQEALSASFLPVTTQTRRLFDAFVEEIAAGNTYLDELNDFLLPETDSDPDLDNGRDSSALQIDTQPAVGSSIAVATSWPTVRGMRFTEISSGAGVQSLMAGGVDVSHYDNDNLGAIHWQSVAAKGVKVAWAKATQGAPSSTGRTFHDPHFVDNISAARAANIPAGPYHFIGPLADPHAQISDFLEKINSVAFDLIPALDVEWDIPAHGSTRDDRWLTISENERVKRLGTCLQSFQDATGKKPVIYTNAAFWHDVLGNPTHFTNSSGESCSFGDYLLWVADYSHRPPHLPKPWSTYAIWQFTESGNVAGLKDLDQLNVPIDQLKY